MVKETLKRIFEFLEEKGEHRTPLKFKLLNNLSLKEEDLNIEGNLDLGYCDNLTSLPEGLKVGGSLSLIFVKIESLPEGLKVGTNLYLQRSKITSLPKGLEVGDSLVIDTIQLLKYTDKELRDMVKPGFIKGKITRESY
jgi:hypothetical protein